MIVIKIGGGAGVNLDATCADAAAVIHGANPQPVVIVHGTSATADSLGLRLNVPARQLQSPSGHLSRYTDPATLEVFTLAAVGSVNVDLVGRLQLLGINAIGLNGLDGKLIQARRKDAVRAIDPDTGRQRIVRDDYTGKIESINASLLHLLIDAGYVPVIAPLAIGVEGERLNVDGDRAAAQIAGALHAETLVILTNVPGLLANFPDEASLIRQIAPHEIDHAMEIAGGRMKRKVLAAQEALAAGTKRVILADSRRESPIQAALTGEGTVIG